MTETTGWSKATYQDSISSRCWTYTPYDQSWDGCRELREDDVLRRLVQQERLLSPVPPWARDLVERSINFIPFCPHWAFPSPYLEVLEAIGRQVPPAFVHGCYTADRGRKDRLQDYVFCLDAWLANADPGQAALELAPRGHPCVDWPQVCVALWEVLGERSEVKELLLRRIVHRQRWWIKSLVWDDDCRDVYCRDQFLGDVHCSGDGYGHYGNPEFGDPYFAELQTPVVQRLEERLAATCPDWPWFRSIIRDSWLCAPKAFRFLERLLWCVGKEKRAVSLPSHPLEGAEVVPGFLQCDDTYPDTAEGKEWVRAFVEGIRAWMAGHELDGKVGCEIRLRLGDRTLMKLWLVGLYLKKIELANPYGAAGPTPPM